MNAPTIHNTNNTNEALFLAPGTHQRSAGEEKGGAITAQLVPEGRRLAVLPRVFGATVMRAVRAEHLVYDWMGRLCANYGGGYWHFYELSNGGFYMAPRSDERFRVCVEGNGFEGELSADAAGIVAVLFALCQLAFDSTDDRYVELYHQLRDFAVSHPEAGAIFRAID